MTFSGPFRWGTFDSRRNRFLALVETARGLEQVHVPNTGRLAELLRPGAPVLLRGSFPERRTGADLWGVRAGAELVSVDSRTPNLVVAHALRHRLIPELGTYQDFRSEVAWRHSRFDFRLSEPELYLEVKGVTLLDEGVARFPDAPTERGRRHLAELTEIVLTGGQGAVMFVVQRPSAVALAPNDATDPAFGSALRAARTAGVLVLAYSLEVGEGRIRWLHPLPLAF